MFYASSTSGSHQRLAVAGLAVFLGAQLWPATSVRSAPLLFQSAQAKQTQPNKVPGEPAAGSKAPEADATKQTELRNRRKNHALLDEAQRLTAEGSYPKANETIVGVLKETNDDEVIQRADRLLKNNEPTTSGKLGLSQPTLLKTASWWIDILLGILILLTLYAVLRVVRFTWSLTQRGTWRLDRIADTTNLGVADLIIESLGRWGSKTPPLTSGLLKLERLQLPSVEWLKPSTTSLDLSEALKDLSVQVGGNLIKLTGIASAGKGIKEWFKTTCPAIRGNAILSGSNLLVSLTARSGDGTVFAITESRRGKNSADPAAFAAGGVSSSLAMAAAASPFSPDDIQSAAQAASYKIFYLISQKGSSLTKAEAANSLREGLNQLWEHVSSQDPDKLETAYEAFREARSQQDDFYEAYLYEGIALDLLSQHDEAIKRFDYLETETRVNDQGLRAKAIYNRAISLFRKYQHPSTRAAEGVLDRLIAEIKEAPEISQIKSMALAAKASVIAQYPMYWTLVAPDGNESAISEVEKAKRSEEAVTRWIGKVAKLKKDLEGILKTIKSKGNWDRAAERQLEWAISNAWGSAHLNCAMYVYSNPDCKEPPPEWKNKRLEYLNEAYKAFQNCALLLTPGVENLTNLAKVTLELGRFAQGCAYLEEVRKMNPSYEYAYFRLAKEWDRKNDTPRVVRILKSYLEKRTPVIPSFVALVERYASELSKSNA